MAAEDWGLNRSPLKALSLPAVLWLGVTQYRPAGCPWNLLWVSWIAPIRFRILLSSSWWLKYTPFCSALVTCLNIISTVLSHSSLIFNILC